jgi:predicted GH43/DUF377 family glycosyl hydrolase
MELKRHPNNPILEKNPHTPWEAGSVFNPSVLYDNGIFRMIYRATNDVQLNKVGGYVSSIGYAESRDGIHFKRSSKPIIIPDQEYEMGLGCEDPRITKIDNKYFIYYTAVKGIGKEKEVRIALATSKDFKSWEKHGVVGPATRSKAAALFPEKINGKYVIFYTLMPDRPFSSIMQAKFDSVDDLINPPQEFMANNINQYEKNVVFAPPQNAHRGPEVGATPIKTKLGWLFIYCPANISDHPQWSINAALLNLHNPKHILADVELLKPETKGETRGVVKNVTFPEGAVIVGNELYVYYGSGDQECCLATCDLQELLDYLSSHSQS